MRNFSGHKIDEKDSDNEPHPEDILQLGHRFVCNISYRIYYY